jgi:hypothetical protein
MSTTTFRPGNNTNSLRRILYIARLNALNKNTNNINCLCILRLSSVYLLGSRNTEKSLPTPKYGGESHRYFLALVLPASNQLRT